MQSGLQTPIPCPITGMVDQLIQVFPLQRALPSLLLLPLEPKLVTH